MPHSKLKKLWDGDKPLENLKYIDLQFSNNLNELPDFFQAPKLEHLDLFACTSLRRIPKINGNLKYLNLSGTGIEELHPSYKSLKNLQHLNLSACRRLSYLPDWFGDLVSMKSLDLLYNSFKRMPSSIKQMTKLQYLEIYQCWNLEYLTDFPSSLQSLQLLGCTNLKSLIDVPISLQNLSLLDCKSLKVISARGCLSLKIISADGCRSLREFIIDEHVSSSWQELDLTFIRNEYPSLSFIGCEKLEESAKANILKLFQLIVYALNIGGYSVVYPGNEIPKWIGHQNEGNSIVVPFPHHPYTLIKGFALSTILQFKQVPQLFSSWLIDVNVGFKTRGGITRKARDAFRIKKLEIDTPYLYIGYFNRFMKEVEDDVEEAIFEISGFNVEIKRCGIQIISQEEQMSFRSR